MNDYEIKGKLTDCEKAGLWIVDARVHLISDEDIGHEERAYFSGMLEAAEDLLPIMPPLSATLAKLQDGRLDVTDVSMGAQLVHMTKCLGAVVDLAQKHRSRYINQ